MAVDINTLYNPYHKRLRNGKEVIEPATARPYLDRSKKHAYMIQRGDLCYRLFKEKRIQMGWRLEAQQRLSALREMTKIYPRTLNQKFNSTWVKASNKMLSCTK